MIVIAPEVQPSSAIAGATGSEYHAVVSSASFATGRPRGARKDREGDRKPQQGDHDRDLESRGVAGGQGVIDDRMGWQNAGQLILRRRGGNRPQERDSDRSPDLLPNVEESRGEARLRWC